MSATFYGFTSISHLIGLKWDHLRRQLRVEGVIL